MSTSLKLIIISLAFALLTPLNAYANIEEVTADIQSACEDEAKGQDDPETYIQQCVEDMLSMLKEEGSEEAAE